MHQIYQRKQFKVYEAEDQYVLHNSALQGFRHTHLRNFKTCKYLIELSLKERYPNDLPVYLLISLARINEGSYQEKILELLKNKRKKDNYYNSKEKRRGKSRKNQ
jgi:hypothetical protein